MSVHLFHLSSATNCTNIQESKMELSQGGVEVLGPLRVQCRHDGDHNNKSRQRRLGARAVWGRG